MDRETNKREDCFAGRSLTTGAARHRRRRVWQSVAYRREFLLRWSSG